MTFSLIRDASGLNTYGIDFNIKPLKYSAHLTGGVEKTITVPGDDAQYLAIFWFEIGANVWVALNDAAVAPIGDPSTTSSDPNPVARRVRAGDVLSFLSSSDTADIWVSFYVMNI